MRVSPYGWGLAAIPRRVAPHCRDEPCPKADARSTVKRVVARHDDGETDAGTGPRLGRMSWIRDRWTVILVLLMLVAGIVAALLLSKGSGTGY